MNGTNDRVSFFMGANTPNGFISLFGGMYNPRAGDRCYIIKGGPGTGKSGLMRNVGEYAETLGYVVEYLFCSSDPDSLDGIIIPELKVCIADGTSPHVIEPRYPGACESIVNLGDYYDSRRLYDNSREIMRLTDECSSCHKKCVRFLASCALLANDCAKMYSRHIDMDKAKRYAARIAAREFFDSPSESGVEKKRFLSAVTPKGICVHTNTPSALCSRAYVLEDDSDLVAPLLLSLLAELALDSGLEIISCRCPLSPFEKIEHLLIPDLELCFLTSNVYHHFELESAKTINMKRFYDEDAVSEYNQRISFNRKTQKEMINEAVGYLSTAKVIHDKLEKFYIDAMDFELVDRRTDALIREIF